MKYLRILLWSLVAFLFVVCLCINTTSAQSVPLVVEGKLTDIKTCIGTYTVTTYCGCKTCNGKWYGQPTASGAPMVPGTTVAVDTSKISFGTELVLELEDGTQLERVAQDTGSAIKGNKIDLLVEDCGSRTTYYNVKVWIYDEAENLGT